MSVFENGLSKLNSNSLAKPLITDRIEQGASIGNLINIENMNNTLGDDVDVQRFGENLARGSKNKLSAYGYKFT